MIKNKILTCGVPSELTTRKTPQEVRQILTELLNTSEAPEQAYEGYASIMRFRVSDLLYSLIKDNAAAQEISIVEYTTNVLSSVL